MSLLLLLCGFVSLPPSAAAAEAVCDNASAQASDLRIEKQRNGSAIEIMDKSARWRVVYRSPGEIDLPRESPDGNFVAYVSTERDSSWLYVQRLSTSAREPVSSLDSKPAQMCFDATQPVIHVISTAGVVKDYDISAQTRLLPGR